VLAALRFKSHPHASGAYSLAGLRLGFSSALQRAWRGRQRWSGLSLGCSSKTPWAPALQDCGLMNRDECNNAGLKGHRKPVSLRPLEDEDRAVPSRGQSHRAAEAVQSIHSISGALEAKLKNAATHSRSSVTKYQRADICGSQSSRSGQRRIGAHATL
jgi:hypothetical protein